MINQIFKYSCGGCIVLHARVIDVLLCISNGRPERLDGRVDRRTGSQTATWTCSREGMFTPCCYLHTVGTCSGCLATCMFAVEGLLGQPEWADSRAGLTCVQEGMFTACYYLPAFGTCSGCLATCIFTKLYYLHALGNRRRTAKAAGAVGWTCGRADRQPDSRVDVLPQGHVHAMLLFARIWHLR